MYALFTKEPFSRVIVYFLFSFHETKKAKVLTEKDFIDYLLFQGATMKLILFYTILVNMNKFKCHSDFLLLRALFLCLFFLSFTSCNYGFRQRYISRCY